MTYKLRTLVWNPWVLTSMVLWALDYISTLWCVEYLGMAEGSPFPARAHEVVGVSGYAALLFPVLLLRGVLAAQTRTDGGWRVARVGCQVMIVFHVLVVIQNFALVVGFYL